MREKLQKINGERLRFKATVGRFGKKTAYKGYPLDTVCFTDVKFFSGGVATDHIWFTAGKRIKELNLQEGDMVSFEARVKPYLKGYEKDEVDFRLSNISKIVKLKIENNELHFADGDKHTY